MSGLKEENIRSSLRDKAFKGKSDAE